MKELNKVLNEKFPNCTIKVRKLRDKTTRRNMQVVTETNRQEIKITFPEGLTDEQKQEISDQINKEIDAFGKVKIEKCYCGAELPKDGGIFGTCGAEPCLDKRYRGVVMVD